MIMTQRAPGDQRRDDIKVIKSGVREHHICPGSQRLVSKGADTIPSKAVAIYDKKTKKYNDQANFVPFIVKTGAANLHFLSRILPLNAEGTAGLTRRAALRGTSRALVLQRGFKLAQIAA
jgi:hypothetical protein